MRMALQYEKVGISGGVRVGDSTMNNAGHPVLISNAEGLRLRELQCWCWDGNIKHHYQGHLSCENLVRYWFRTLHCPAWG